jgi:hypothetical protein
MSATWDAIARDLYTAQLRSWLANHGESIAAGVNVGQIQRDKAQAFRLELAKR